MNVSAVHRLGRELLALSLYRYFLVFLFLVAGFSHFPAHQLPIAVGTFLFLQGMIAVITATAYQAQAANLVADMAERKTRHAILLAAELGQNVNEYTFWGQVNDRVQQEVGEAQTATGFWRSTLLVGSNIAVRALTDLVVVAVAFAFSNPIY